MILQFSPVPETKKFFDVGTITGNHLTITPAPDELFKEFPDFTREFLKEYLELLAERLLKVDPAIADRFLRSSNAQLRIVYETAEEAYGKIEIRYIWGWEDKEVKIRDKDMEHVGKAKLQGKEMDVLVGTRERGGFIIGWECKLGFGEMTFVMSKGRLEVQTEHMGADFVEALLNAFRKQLVVVE